MGAIWNSLTGKGPKAPAPIDVNKVRGEAGEQNTEDAFKNAAFNRLNQTNAYGGRSTYTQTGVDANGNPIFSQATEWGQPTKDFYSGLSGLGGQYISRAQNMLDNPADLSSMPAFQQAQDYATANLGRQFQLQQDAMDNRLKNQGLEPGTPAYDNAMRSLTSGFGDAYMNAINPIQQQLWNQNLAGEQFKTSQLAQLGNPGLQAGFAGLGAGFQNIPGVNVGGVDVAGLYNQQKAQEQAAYEAKMRELGGEWGALGQIGGAGLKWWLNK